MIAVVPSSSQIVVDHKAIPGFMDAMTMGYRVEPPSLLGGEGRGRDPLYHRPAAEGHRQHGEDARVRATHRETPMPSQSLACGGGRVLLAYKAGYVWTLLLLVTGCATFDQRAGFSDVSTVVEARSGKRVVWYRGSELDTQVDQEVRALLHDTLTVDGAVQVALLNNRTLQALYAELGVAQADLVQAGLLRNPVFDGAVRFLLSGGPAKVDLSAALDFLDIFYLPLRKRVAAARFEEAKLQVTGAVLDFAATVQGAFYRHQANEQRLELLQTMTQALAASFEVAQRLHAAGNITDLDLARERAVFEEAKVQLRAAESAGRQSREHLNTLMGLWGQQTTWQIDRRLPRPPRPKRCRSPTWNVPRCSRASPWPAPGSASLWLANRWASRGRPP